MPQLSHLWNGRAVAADNQKLQWPSSSHVWMWEFDHKEGWVPKIDAFELWCWRRLLRVHCTTKRSNQSILKDQSWIFIGGTDAEAEAPILWPPDVKSQLTGKDSDGGKDRSQEEKGMIEDEMVGWHQWLKFEFEQVLGDGEGQGSLACCSPWDHKERDTTEWLNSNNKETLWGGFPPYPHEVVWMVFTGNLAPDCVSLSAASITKVCVALIIWPSNLISLCFSFYICKLGM